MTPRDVLSFGPVLPVVVIDDPADAVPLARALLAGGIRAMEVTLRTACAAEAIAAIARQVDGMTVGAGTMCSGADIALAERSGARFAVSPGLTTALGQAASRSGLPLIPGMATASELMAGREAGFDTFKFFPAEAAGGIALLESLAGPFPDVRFCPTGGIGADNAAKYLALGNVPCVGGTWVSPRALVRARDWAGITLLARQAFALASAG